jgi:hypothetical protein
LNPEPLGNIPLHFTTDSQPRFAHFRLTLLMAEAGGGLDSRFGKLKLLPGIDQAFSHQNIHLQIKPITLI